MKREKCKNHDECKGWQMYTSLKLCRNCYMRELMRKHGKRRNGQMATIENLGKKSLSELSREEAIEMLRQIRLSRRTSKPKKSPKKATKAKKVKEKKQLSAEQAKKLLELLGG